MKMNLAFFGEEKPQETREKALQEDRAKRKRPDWFLGSDTAFQALSKLDTKITELDERLNKIEFMSGDYDE
ncbi:MAG: hypothetical protein ACREUI_08965 [Burkholderiales bacterium]